MEKKIKAVKLKTNGLIIPTLKFRESDRHWYLNDLQWSEENILSGRLNDLFEIEYEPERKFIDVRIEQTDADSVLTFEGLQDYLSLRGIFKVTELPEGTWTDEDIREIFKSYFSSEYLQVMVEKYKAQNKYR